MDIPNHGFEEITFDVITGLLRDGVVKRVGRVLDVSVCGSQRVRVFFEGIYDWVSR